MEHYREKDSVLARSLKKFMQGMLLLLFMCIATLLVFYLLEKYDNKYSHYSLQPQKGVLTIDDTSFANGRFACLIDDWEFDNGIKPRYLFVGQYSNYALGEKGADTYGRAAYRLKIVNNSEPQVLSMEVPELFSASKIYVNGSLVASLGRMTEDNYQARIQNQIISFEASKETEVVIEIANYSHYYSGMFYPPILGTTKTVTAIVMIRLIFYGILCFSTLAIAFFSLVIWRGRKDEGIFTIYGVLALSFGIHVCYPFVRWLGLPFTKTLYAVEDVSEYIMIACVILISTIIAGENMKAYYKKAVIPVSIGMCLISGIVPLFVLKSFPVFVPVYGNLVDGYQVVISIYILTMAFVAMSRGIRGSYLMLCGNVLFSVGILKDVFTSNLFEPIRGGWLKEYTGFFMVIVFSIMIQQYFKAVMQENEKLTEHLEYEVQLRTKELRTVLSERKKLLSEVAHDLKAPVSSIQTFIEYMKIGNIQIDDETKTYLAAIEQKSMEVQNRVTSLQKLSAGEQLIERKERLCLNKFLEEIYNNSLPDAEANGIYLKIDLPAKDFYAAVDKKTMTRALENIIYNALDFTPVNGVIQIKMKPVKDVVKITIADTGCGIKKTDIDHVFERGYTNRTGGEARGNGLGLHIAKTIILGHGGTIGVKSELGKGTQFEIIINRSAQIALKL